MTSKTPCVQDLADKKRKAEEAAAEASAAKKAALDAATVSLDD